MGSVTNFPFGVSSFGVVLPGSTGGPLSVPLPNGQSWFVDANNGSDGNNGGSAGEAFRTIGRALQYAGDGTGDTIYVAPGEYNETILVTKDYITIVGMVQAGYAKPDWGPANSAECPCKAIGQGFQARHIRFFADGGDVFQQAGNGFFINDCVFDGDGTASKGVRLIPTAYPTSADTSHTASEGVITGCLFRGCAVGLIFDTAAAPLGVGSTDNVISNNRFQANTLDIATADSGSGTYSLKTTDFIGNYFVDKNKATYVDLTTTNGGAASDQTGTFAMNGFASDTMTTTKVKAVGTGFTFMGNYDTVGIFDGSGLD